jgi:hypothetical protein
MRVSPLRLISFGASTFSANTTPLGRPVMTPRICTVTGMLGSLAVNCSPMLEITWFWVKLKVWASGSRGTKMVWVRQTTCTTGTRMMRFSMIRSMRVMTSGSLICRLARAE